MHKRVQIGFTCHARHHNVFSRRLDVGCFSIFRSASGYICRSVEK
ncbi:hypothetical protein TPChic_0972a [Treponema pallidum subsp. pallidum str. Chicago]|nr:hypothetical protein TPChic_0972a [Treponema pallidum subsp. pallidum str. Chicago]